MRVFITGITGTLGTALTELHAERGDTVFGCARNESRACDWLRSHGKVATLFLADAATLADFRSDIGRLLPSLGRVYHCAAMKHVDLCEQNPHEAHRQNVDLTAAVAVACESAGVPCVAVSSDKACLPEGVYGATKLLAERVAVRHGAAAVRLGNLIGSSGSVFQAWKTAVARGECIKLTDPNMTRYFMPVLAAAEFLADDFEGGVVNFPADLRAVTMGDVAAAVAGHRVEVVGRRPGETRHQWLVAPGDRVRQDGPTCVLGDGEALPSGLSSETAPRWDVGELLAVAGVTP